MSMKRIKGAHVEAGGDFDIRLFRGVAQDLERTVRRTRVRHAEARGEILRALGYFP